MNLILRSCVVIIAVFSVSFCKAQINLEFTSVNEYAFNTKEALNLIVTNGTTKPFNVIFNGRIKDANGQTVVEFKSHEATLNLGATIFSPQNISFSETQYFNNDIAEIEASSGSYPSGNYSICVWATCTTPDCNGTGSDNVSHLEPRCIQIHIENPTPLLLATPENESEIESTRPLYTWIPPSPVAGSANLNYTMILVELLDGQSKADALTQNRPLIELEGIGNPALMHPSDLPELETGKWYAWQVQAYVGKTPIAKSEQWKFKVKKKEKKETTILVYELKQEMYNETYIVRTDSLKLKYLEQYNVGQNNHLKFTIIGENGLKIESLGTDKTIIKEGVGEYTLFLRFPGLNLSDGSYIIVVENLKKEKWYLRFKLEGQN